MMDNVSPQVSELRRGAGVLAAATVGMMLGLSAIPLYTLGVFAGPVTEATGWSMSQFQFHFTVVSLGVLAAPLHGLALDRFSPRKVVLASIVFFAIAVMLAGWMAMLGLYAFYAAWLVAAIAGQSTGPVGWTKFVTGWFDTRRGIALGIALSGSGIFAIMGPLLGDAAITQFGWEGAYIALGAAVLFINLPVSYFLLRDPVAVTDGAVAELTSFAWRDTIANYRFGLILVAFALLGFVTAGLISNLVPILQVDGLSRGEAAALAGLVGVSILIARILVGFLLDRFWAPGVAAIAMALPTISCLALAGYFDMPPALSVILIGFCAGAEFDILAYFISRYFPRKAYGRIYGVAYMALMAGAGIAPPLFGSNFDQFGNYTQILTISAIIFVIAPFSLLLLGKEPKAAAPARP